MSELILYTFFRSSAAYRVRIALHLKDLPFESRFINLRGNNEQNQPDYLRVNPQGLIPTLLHAGKTINQSMAIIEYLDETFPASPLLPRDPEKRAHIRAFAQSIACDIHPLNNLRVLQYLKNTLTLDDAAQTAWYQHWIKNGFTALETWLRHHSEAHELNYCFDTQPTLADVLLVPQIYNATRYKCDLQLYPNMRRIYANCLLLPAFQQARPENQPDAP